MTAWLPSVNSSLNLSMLFSNSSWCCDVTNCKGKLLKLDVCSQGLKEASEALWYPLGPMSLLRVRLLLCKTCKPIITSVMPASTGFAPNNFHLPYWSFVIVDAGWQVALIFYCRYRLIVDGANPTTILDNSHKKFRTKNVQIVPHWTLILHWSSVFIQTSGRFIHVFGPTSFLKDGIELSASPQFVAIKHCWLAWVDEVLCCCQCSPPHPQPCLFPPHKNSCRR